MSKTWYALTTIVLTAAVFGQVWGHQFLIWDDELHVVNNPRLNPVTWAGLGEIWSEPYGGLYIPLSYTFFAAESVLSVRLTGRLDPLVFHLGNLALHLGCVLLVFVILLRLFRHEGAAVAGALLFGLHPVQVESVAWVSETRGLLCGLFSLLAVWQYVCYAREKRANRRKVIAYLLAGAAFVLALLCKPTAVALPLVVAVLDAGLLRHRWRVVLLSIAPWLLLSVAWTILTKFQQPDRAMSFVTPLWSRPLLAGDALAFYMYKLAAPLQYGADYGRTPSWLMQQWWIWIVWLLPAAFLAALACLPGRRIWLTSAGVFAACLLPVLGLVSFDYQRISTVADRYVYLAMLGPALALAAFITWRPTRLTATFTAALLILLALPSFYHTGHWRDNEAWAANTLRVNPQSVVGNHNLGFLRSRQGEDVKAIDYYLKVLDVDPRYAQTELNLGLALDRLDNIDESIEAMERAASLRPDWAQAYYHLGGVVWSRKGDLPRATRHFRKAVDLDSKYLKAHESLASILAEQGDYAEAVKVCRGALRAAEKDPKLTRRIQQTMEFYRKRRDGQ